MAGLPPHHAHLSLLFKPLKEARLLEIQLVNGNQTLTPDLRHVRGDACQ